MPYKVDAAMRRMLETRFHSRQDDARRERHDTLMANMHAAVSAWLRAEYGPMQRDMPTLRAYDLARRIKGVNMWSYDLRRSEFRRLGGIDMPDTELWAPGARAEYPIYTIRQDNPDYPLACHVRQEMYDGEARGTAERTAFAAAIRSTGSWNRLVQMFPWISFP